MSDLLAAHPLPILLACAAFMGLGGFSKGAVGFALPLIGISGMAMLLPAQTAVAALICATLVTNLWQTFRQGIAAAWGALRRFWLLNAVLFAMIAASAQLVNVLPEAVLFGILGAGITLFSAIQLLGVRLPDPGRFRRQAEVGTGLVGGFFGGLSGVWGPPVVLLLTAMGIEKTEQMRAQGVSFLIGSIVLVVAHLRSGLLSGVELSLSLAMVIPACVGMAAGLAVHDRMDQRLFRRATLAVLTVAGLNLLRRAAMG